jgi:hypothetical protein
MARQALVTHRCRKPGSRQWCRRCCQSSLGRDAWQWSPACKLPLFSLILASLKEVRKLFCPYSSCRWVSIAMSMTAATSRLRANPAGQTSLGIFGPCHTSGD